MISSNGQDLGILLGLAFGFWSWATSIVNFPSWVDLHLTTFNFDNLISDIMFEIYTLDVQVYTPYTYYIIL